MNGAAEAIRGAVNQNQRNNYDKVENSGGLSFVRASLSCGPYPSLKLLLMLVVISIGPRLEAATFSAEELAARRAEAKARGDWLKAELEAAAVLNLSYFEFDENSWFASRRYAPLEASNLQLVPGWSSNAVSVDSSSPAILRYRDIEADGHTNFLAHRGSLRLWFKPNWSSMSWGGSGPGDVAVLFACGTLNATSSWLGLSLDPTGSRLSFAGQTNGTGAEYLHCSVALLAGEWHEIVLTYSATNSVLYLNGAMLANGSGVIYWPDAATRAARGFTIGSEDSGAAQARGAFENVALFDRPLRPASVTNHYARWLTRGSPGGTSDDATAAWIMAETPFVFTGVNWTGSTDLGGAAHYGTNTLWLELVQAPNPSILVVHGTEPGTYYQVLGKRHLNDAQWTIETSILATSSNTTVTLPYLGRNPLFFMAGKDTDGDGLPDFIEDANHNGIVDAGETSFLDPDSDGDGRTDAEELLYDGTNPLNGSDAAASRLGYWRFNSSALLGQDGQTPLLDEDTQLITAWSGSALLMDDSYGVLAYRDREPLGGANLNCRIGSARFWFKPDWNSGTGPGATGYFLTLGNTTTSADGWRALSVNSAGDHLSFVTQTNGSTTTHFSTAINWTTGAWHQVVLTYNGSETKLYIDGTSAATGTAVARWPRREARAAGFTVGGNRAGDEHAKGQLDELETFNYVLSASEISANYNQLTATTPIAIGLPGSINTNFITATLSGATAAQMTAVVAPASRDSATWLPFADTITATLGNTNGDYAVYFGFRTILGTVLWTTNFITLDTVAPMITLENPPSSVVTNSLLHVYARVPESIRGDSIRWSLSNTLGVVSGNGGWADQAYDPVTFHWTTNWFACYDLRMTNGTNRLTLQVTDDAGNTTVTNFILTTDFSGLTTAPVTTMLWPLSGMTISGSNLTLHGQVDDPAALLSVEITTPTSEILTVPLAVLAKGGFTSDELKLDAGTSSVKVTARNANGLSSSTTFSVTVSTVVLNASSPPANMADPTVTVSGTVSAASYNVWVNGMPATVNGGNWTVANVANPGGDNPVFNIRAIPSNVTPGAVDVTTGNPTHAQAVNHVFLGERPPKIEMVSYENKETWHDTIGGPLFLLSEKDEFWMKEIGGSATNKLISDDDVNNSWQRWFFWKASGRRADWARSTNTRLTSRMANSGTPTPSITDLRPHRQCGRRPTCMRAFRSTPSRIGNKSTSATRRRKSN